MYKSFDPSDRIFVNREEYLQWMDKALERCKEKSVVLHLRGIGGIGKSSLLNHWTNTIDSTVRLDCQQYTEFYSRLDILAKGAVRVGITLNRFDILWHIRKRFVEGVEPAQEKGRDWAKEVVMAIPFIGSLASIGSAIKAVSDNVGPKLRKRYGEVGLWLQNRLGTEYVERLLEILWKEPHHAEFLFLDALVEDINNRKNPDEPILFLFDHSENVDAEEQRWKYAGKRITETELWYVFLSSLKNCVGVVASRNQAPENAEEEYSVEKAELTELDRISSIELLERRNVIEESLQERIVSVSGGNPFILDAICDLLETRDLTNDDIETLRANTLDEVRLKTWRKLFSQAKELLYLVDRTGLVPFFTKQTIDIIAPDMKTDQWERFIRLSFVKLREDGTRVLHDLARELARAELGKKLNPLVEEVSSLLEKASIEEDNLTLLGHAYSVQFLASEEVAIRKAKKKINDLLENFFISDAFSVIDNLVFVSTKGQAELLGLKGKAFQYVNRWSEAEIVLEEAILINEELANETSDMHLDSVAEYSFELGNVHSQNLRFPEAESLYQKAIEIQRSLVAKEPDLHLENLGHFLLGYAFLFYMVQHPQKGIPLVEEAVVIFRRLDEPIFIATAIERYAISLQNSGRYSEAEKAHRESLKLHRELAKKYPDTPRLKASIAAILINMIQFVHDETEAKEHFTEAIQFRRELAELGTEHFQGSLAATLTHYGFFHLGNFNHEEAEIPLKESHEIYSNLVKDNPGAWLKGTFLLDFMYLRLYIESRRIPEAQTIIDRLLTQAKDFGLVPIRGVTQNNRAIIHVMSLRESEAEMCFQEAIEALENMGPGSMELLWFLTVSYINYCTLLKRMDRITDIREILDRALNIIRDFEGFYTYDVLKAIIVGTVATQQEQADEASNKFKEAIRLLEDFVSRFPQIGLPHLSITLNNYSLFLKTTGELDEAERTLKRALEIKKQLAESRPTIFEEKLATTLTNWGILLYERGRSEDAEDVIRQVLQIRRKLVEEHPGWYRLELASILHNLGVFLKKEGRTSEAEDVLRESIALRTELAKTAPSIIQRIETLIGDSKNEKWLEEDDYMHLHF